MVRTTRRQLQHNVKVPRIRSDLRQKALRFHGLSTWNAMSLVAKCIDKFTEFKRVLSAMVHDLFGDHPVWLMIYNGNIFDYE